MTQEEKIERTALARFDRLDVIQLSDEGREQYDAGNADVTNGPLKLTGDLQYGTVYGDNTNGTIVYVSQDDPTAENFQNIPI